MVFMKYEEQINVQITPRKTLAHQKQQFLKFLNLSDNFESVLINNQIVFMCLEL